MDELKSSQQLHVLWCLYVHSQGVYPSYPDLTPTSSPGVLSQSQQPLRCIAQGIFAWQIFGCRLLSLRGSLSVMYQNSQAPWRSTSLVQYSQSHVSSVKLYTYRAMAELLQGNSNCKYITKLFCKNL